MTWSLNRRIHSSAILDFIAASLEFAYSLAPAKWGLTVAVRDRRDAGELSSHGVLSLRGRLRAQMSRPLQGHYTNSENARFAKHLRNYEQALFVFLTRDDVEATIGQAEHAMRAAVMTRKTCRGGNRTPAGAKTQAILMSVLRNSHHKALDPLQVARAIHALPPWSRIWSSSTVEPPV